MNFWKRPCLYFTSLLLISVTLSCTNDPAMMFSKLSPSDTGIRFKNANIENEDYNVFVYEYFYNGGGVALGDINNDGLVDIYFSSNQGANTLYLNQGDFKFEDISVKAGVQCEAGWKTGVAMVDLNADGFLDIYVCRSAANESNLRKNSLLINNGDLTFTDLAEQYGLDNNSYSTQASFLDYDRDGDLDMFLLNHAVSRIVRNFDIRTESKTQRVPFVGNQLFENINGKFVDVSDSAGVYGPAHNFGLGVCYSDLNSDGWPDVYTSNDYTGSDKLLINDRSKKFNEEQLVRITHMSRFSMGVDIADVNNDGLPDIYSLDMLPDNNKRQKELMWADNYDVYNQMVKNGLHHQFMRNMLHLNNGGGYFSEVEQAAGISNTDWSWAALFADYDNDGLQDLFVSNGYKRDYTNSDFAKYRANQLLAKNAGQKNDSYTKMLTRMPSTKVHSYLFKNSNGTSFTDVSEQWGMGEPALTHGVAYADLDNDGDLDLVANRMDETAGIFRNNANTLIHNNYLKIRLHGKGKNTFGIGAKVTLYINDTLMMRELCPYRGFQSSVEPLLFFGTGKVELIDSLVVDWPDGGRQRLFKVPVNQTLAIKQANQIVPQPSSGVQKTTLFRSDTVVQYHHHENPFIDFKYQTLLTRMYSSQGPAVAYGDVDGDGLKDYYFGGAKGQEGELHLQQPDGSFEKKTVGSFRNDVESEATDGVFVDVDNDRDLDLYVVTGGYEYADDDKFLEDKLYLNNGRGDFVKGTLPPMRSSGSCVRPSDFDNDGDIDLFVGGRITPGRYPHAPESYLLSNDGKGGFTIVTSFHCPQLTRVGMVTDAAWTDLNNDGQPDLIVCGEWMPVMIFINENGKLTDKSGEYFHDRTSGFWNVILVNDFDHDGDPDFIIGNQGLNTQLKPTPAMPATLYYDDFDGNGSVDPLLCYYIKDKSYPFATRDELTEQLPAMKKKFPKYADYATAELSDILPPEAIAKSSKLEAHHLETTYFRNDGNKIILRKLPPQLQFAPVFALALMDVNGDGLDDLVTGGNLERTRARTGLMKGNNGFIFRGDGKGGFQFMSPYSTGINMADDVREIVVDEKKVSFIINNGPIKSYILND